MNSKVVNDSGVSIVVVNSSELIIHNVPSALDFVMSMTYEFDSNRIVINKEAIAEDFFILSTGVAGEILQKFVNYRFHVAIVGDYSKYTSKPLKDFIYESNYGNDIFFVSTEEEAIQKLRLIK